MQVLYTDGKSCRIFKYLYNKIVCRVLSYKAPVDLLQGVQGYAFQPQ
jgi:hypothetical protein